MAFATQMKTSTLVQLPAQATARASFLRAAAIAPARATRFVVRASDPKQVAQEAKSEVEQKLDSEVGPAARDAVETTTQRTFAETSPAQQQDGFGKIMAFSGFAPERVNSRLAMLGIVAALGAELATGQSLAQQVADAPIAIAATFLTFIAASIIPTLKGVKPDQRDNSVFNSKAELYNGRLAMLGFAALIATEVVKGGALL